MRKCGAIGALIFSLLIITPSVFGQNSSNAQKDPTRKFGKNNYYATIGGGGILCSQKNGGNLGPTFGADIGTAKRLGVNLEGGSFYGAIYEGAGFGFFSPGVSVHPLGWKNPRTDFFISSGYTVMGVQSRAKNMFYIGAGLNHWSSETKRFGIRAEFRDQIGSASGFLNVDGAIHILQVRVGVAIR